MKIYDISWPISQATTGYKDKDVVRIHQVKDFDVDKVRETNITLGSHSGTHLDAPSHFLRDGLTIDQLAVNRFVGSCQVLDLTDVMEKISAQDLQQHSIAAGEIVLFKTSNSLQNPTDKFSPHFIYLDSSGARYLAEKKVRAVGIDYLGIERGQQGHPTHTTLMHVDILIYEGLRLGNINPGRYFFVGLPLYVVGTEAAPVRAILIDGLSTT